MPPRPPPLQGEEPPEDPPEDPPFDSLDLRWYSVILFLVLSRSDLTFSGLLRSNDSPAATPARAAPSVAAAAPVIVVAVSKLDNTLVSIAVTVAVGSYVIIASI
jgi:hypothetical protein